MALVSGAGRGIGRRIALALAAHGASAVVVNDLNEDRAAAVAREVEAAGAAAYAAVGDVADPAAVERMLSPARATLGGVQVLVNNAGIPPGSFETRESLRLFEETAPADWEPWIRVNLLGVMTLTRAVLPEMLAAGWGRIVTIISDSARTGDRGMAAYAAAKAGAAGFSRSLAREVAARGVTANCVALGTVEPEGGLSPEAVRRLSARYPAGRLGTPDDVSAAVLFLVSEATGWITGQTLPVNGGYSMAL